MKTQILNPDRNSFQRQLFSLRKFSDWQIAALCLISAVRALIMRDSRFSCSLKPSRCFATSALFQLLRFNYYEAIVRLHGNRPDISKILALMITRCAMVLASSCRFDRR